MRVSAVVVLAFSSLTLAAHADAKPKRPKDEDRALDEMTVRAREAFGRGTAAVKAGQWSEALQAFEQANSIKPSSVALFNIGYSQRALGRYVLAKASFEKALEGAAEMPTAQVDEAKAYLSEIDEQLARVKITLDPPNARLAIDGRPLVPFKPNDPKVLVAGIAPAGEGTTPRAPVFDVVIDPGMHLITASFPGHTNVLVNRTIAPKSREEIPLKLSELPANIHVESDQPRAVVMLDGRDVGLAPVDLTRPAGRYQIEVQKKGFMSYQATLTLAPGQKANLAARLAVEKESIVQKWWFWGGAAAVVAGGITAAYLLTRPEPQPPDYQRGSLGWLTQPK